MRILGVWQYLFQIVYNIPYNLRKNQFSDYK